MENHSLRWCCKWWRALRLLWLGRPRDRGRAQLLCVVTASVSTPRVCVGVAECLSGAVPQPQDSVPLTTPCSGEAVCLTEMCY